MAKRPNRCQGFGRNEGQEEQCGADTCQCLTGRADGANRSPRHRSFFFHCEQAEAAGEYEALDGGNTEILHKRSEVKNAAY